MALGEYNMITDANWEEAWRGRERKPRHKLKHGDEVLCLPCLSQRLGRPLRHCDFTMWPKDDRLDRFHEWGVQDEWNRQWRNDWEGDAECAPPEGDDRFGVPEWLRQMVLKPFATWPLGRFKLILPGASGREA
jgi:hypothetical protein